MTRLSRNRVPARIGPGVSSSTLLIELMICGQSTMSEMAPKTWAGCAATVFARLICTAIAFEQVAIGARISTLDPRVRSVHDRRQYLILPREMQSGD